MEHIYGGSRTQNELVLDDFHYIIEALQYYKQAYGDMDISSKFDVPAENPWPSHLHGLRLGKRLEKLLSSPQFFQNHADKVQELRKAGFEPNVNTLFDDWAMIITSLRVYKDLYGELRVPSKFVVPDDNAWPRLTRNLKLGVRVAAMRSAGRYVKDHPERKAELDELGFEWRLREVTHKQQVGEEKFEQIFAALVCYKQHVSDELNVPNDYIVPSTLPWPEETWGLDLGGAVQVIRDKETFTYRHTEREDRLNQIGFPWEEAGKLLYAKRRFEIIYSALITYKELYGDLFVPQAFVIPSTEPWPELSWGLKLGARVNAIRSQGTLVANSPERRDLLDKLGFTWELPSHVKRRKRLAEAAEDGEEEVKKEYSTPGPKPTPYTLAPPATSVSAGLASRWPVSGEEEVSSASRDKLRISSLPLPGRMNADRRSVLAYDASRQFEPVAYRELAAEAMREHMQGREYSMDPDIRQFAHFEGHLTPQEFHGAISRGIADEDIKAMKKLGYKILEFGRFNWNNAMAALTTYKNYFGHVDVPQDFVIDAEVLANTELGFEEYLEDMRLGEICAGLRIGDIDGLEEPARKKFLDSLGFDWGDKNKHLRFRFVPMLMGLKLYRHLYGFPMPALDFVVPDEAQWPYWMYNMPLGEWATVARVQQQMLLEHYPHRYDMLIAMDFYFWLPPDKRLKDKYYKRLP